jgi:hypothetical protein
MMLHIFSVQGAQVCENVESYLIKKGKVTEELFEAKFFFSLKN